MDTIYIKMDYTKHYNLLIEKAKNRVIKDKSIYTEKHHIIPRSEGGTDDPSNIVQLFPREHFVAHWLLYRENPTPSRGFSFNMMASNRNYTYTPSSRAYKEGVEAASLAMSKTRTGLKVITDPKTRKEKYIQPQEIDYWVERGWILGRLPGSRNSGRFWSNNGQVENFSKELKEGWKKGRLNQSFTKNKKAISKNKKVKFVKNPEKWIKKGWALGNTNHNKPWKHYKEKVLTCPYCSKTGGYQGMKANHFEYCKYK